MALCNEINALPCVILCGGKSTRFGADKSSALLGGKPLLAHVIERVSTQCSPIALNGLPESYALSHTYPILDDSAPDMGPLAGILAAMRWADSLGFTRVFTVSLDTPFIPDNWARTLACVDANAIAIPIVENTQHRVIALWPTCLHTSLFDFLMNKKERKVGRFIDLHTNQPVQFPTQNGFDPFFNINTKEDMGMAESILDKLKA